MDAGTGPCAGLCANPIQFSVPPNYQSGNLGTAATCHETMSNINGGNCGNFVDPRTFSINGAVVSCTAGNWPASATATKRNGGYCFQATAGNQSFAFFTVF